MRIKDIFNFTCKNLCKNKARTISMLFLIIITCAIAMSLLFIFHIEEKNFRMLYEEKYVNEGTNIRLRYSINGLNNGEEMVEFVDGIPYEIYKKVRSYSQKKGTANFNLGSNVYFKIGAMPLSAKITDFTKPLNVVQGEIPIPEYSSSQKVWVSANLLENLEGYLQRPVAIGENFNINAEKGEGRKRITIALGGVLEESDMIYIGADYLYSFEEFYPSSISFDYKSNANKYEDIIAEQTVILNDLKDIIYEINNDSLITPQSSILSIHNEFQNRYRKRLLIVFLPLGFFILMNISGIINNVILSFDEDNGYYALARMLGMRSVSIFSITMLEFGIILTLGVSIVSLLMYLLKDLLFLAMNYTVYDNLMIKFGEFEWTFFYPWYVPLIIFGVLLLFLSGTLTIKVFCNKKYVIGTLREEL